VLKSKSEKIAETQIAVAKYAPAKIAHVVAHVKHISRSKHERFNQNH
jgi:hypothetical protein